MVAVGVRLTSLFGVGGGTDGYAGERIGALEPWENAAIEVLSGPTLERRLPCCEDGRIESLLIHELLDEVEFLGVSAIVLNCGSTGLDMDCRRLGALGEVSWAVLGL